MNSKAQIVATVGPASEKFETFLAMARGGADLARLNFAWGDFAQKVTYIAMIRSVEKEIGRHIPIVVDLPGPRVQETDGHTYDKSIVTSFTAEDRESVKFGIENGVDYFALSFVGGVADVQACRDVIKEFGGTQKIIAKIERKIAVENLDEIVAAADAIMVARGDLGSEFPLEQIPFVQVKIIQKAKAAHKPVITATQMMLSMTASPVPTRAEVTDVAYAILEGSDAVMLSEESATGKYPVEAVTMMEKVILEAETHLDHEARFNTFQ